MTVETLAAHPGLNVPLRFAHRNHLLVLAYHGVEDHRSFDRHLGILAQTRSPISLAQLSRHISTDEPLPPSPLLVTFDDGRRSVLTNGLPILTKHAVPAALFVVTGLIGTDSPYWWNEVEQLSMAGGTTSFSTATGLDLVRQLKTASDSVRLTVINDLRATRSRAMPMPSYPHLTHDELRQLDASGVAIGSHSVSHPLLDNCDGAKILSELRDSRTVLEEWLDRPVTAVAYPNGNVTAPVAGLARRSGYEIGFLFNHRLQRRAIHDPLMISRVRVDATASVARLKALTSGLLPMIHRLRRLP